MDFPSVKTSLGFIVVLRDTSHCDLSHLGLYISTLPLNAPDLDAKRHGILEIAALKGALNAIMKNGNEGVYLNADCEKGC